MNKFENLFVNPARNLLDAWTNLQVSKLMVSARGDGLIPIQAKGKLQSLSLLSRKDLRKAAAIAISELSHEHEDSPLVWMEKARSGDDDWVYGQSGLPGGQAIAAHDLESHLAAFHDDIYRHNNDLPLDKIARQLAASEVFVPPMVFEVTHDVLSDCSESEADCKLWLDPNGVIVDDEMQKILSRAKRSQAEDRGYVLAPFDVETKVATACLTWDEADAYRREHSAGLRNMSVNAVSIKRHPYLESMRAMLIEHHHRQEAQKETPVMMRHAMDWSVYDGERGAGPNEPAYDMKVTTGKGSVHVDVIAAGLFDDGRPEGDPRWGLPTMSFTCEISGGVPCLHVYNAVDGEIVRSIIADVDDPETPNVRLGDASALAVEKAFMPELAHARAAFARVAQATSPSPERADVPRG